MWGGGGGYENENDSLWLDFSCHIHYFEVLKFAGNSLLSYFEVAQNSLFRDVGSYNIYVADISLFLNFLPSPHTTLHRPWNICMTLLYETETSREKMGVNRNRHGSPPTCLHTAENRSTCCIVFLRKIDGEFLLICMHIDRIISS